ncbi:GTP-binding protein Di-Ras2-like [Mya arenaria]|uniref:GTP-binding protein Di-Ras2-like n=1 Tax=Mya arenaria TaxID=6604 RepID=UPI0022E85CF9|nr:GTP-binding protein Di-Ras2-like [Mya arenaria]XP_052821293.1 GTP-binding protein Di-Ras2-like [Mya arenaria]
MSEQDQRNRVVFLGAGGVGKSSILKRFLFNTYSDTYLETVEDLYSREYTFQGAEVIVDFLDTAGKLVFPAMRRLSITTAHAFVLVYSVTEPETFEEVKRLWEEIKEVRSNYEDLPCVIVGNKVDLEDNRQVEKFDALNWVYNDENCGAFVEVSAKNGECIVEVFKLLMEKAKNPRAKINEPFMPRRLSEHSLEVQSQAEVSANKTSENGSKFSRTRSLIRRGSKPKIRKSHARSQHRQDCVIS